MNRDIATVAAKGALQLIVGRIVSRAIGLIGGLVLIHLLKPEEYGLLTIAAVAPTIFMLFSDFGVNVAATRYLAMYRFKGETQKIRSILYASLIFKVALGIMLTALCYVLAEPFSASAIGKPYAAPLVQLASLLVLGWTLYRLSESLFLGVDASQNYVVLMIIQETLGAILPIVLVIYGMGVMGALLGMVTATLLAGFLGIQNSVFIIGKLTRHSKLSLELTKTLRKMFTFGTPLAISHLVVTGLGSFFKFIISTFTTPSDVGNYSAAETVTSSVYYLTDPVSAMLFPMFSKIDFKNEPTQLKKIYYYSVKYSSLLALPIVMLMMVLSRQLTNLLFGARYESSWLYLTLLSAHWLTYGLGSSHLWKLLSAQEETKFVAILDILTAIIGIGLSILLVPLYGIIGLILTLFIAIWPSYFIAFKKAYKRYGIAPPLHAVWKLYISLTIIVLVSLPITLMPIADGFKILLAILASGIVYVIAAPIMGVLKEIDMNNIENILKTQPVIGSVARKILKVMKRIGQSKGGRFFRKNE